MGRQPVPPQGGTGRKPVPSSLSKPWEGLQHQINSEKDPEIRLLLEKAAALKKQQAAPENKELPLQDKRAKLKGQVRKLTAALDKQQELLAAQQTKVQQLRRELATTHIELTKLPEDVLPAPKKIPMALLEPSLVSMMQYVQSKAKAGDLDASTVLE
eukprot:6109442-Amphidinium_carterae.1